MLVKVRKSLQMKLNALKTDGKSQILLSSQKCTLGIIETGLSEAGCSFCPLTNAAKPLNVILATCDMECSGSGVLNILGLESMGWDWKGLDELVLSHSRKFFLSKSCILV